ncbi:DinB family protein [Mycolicibacillus parakoreensis]|uniref:DinB family protein n=1 Tax=Mycolicibacillus parakoreensis TaxID=1069221 RepID=A0ABY3TY08_9MYCO|nr:DinB family protein [Mycolicibacillus parakoreensis]MCV7316366.1 DinB family protein [Mycolicibacillus parakoreensis]ULN52608.1 DinB family protein [Mycolicibacillus parakoreensis]HLR99682.1 DinB family protein [Mycolicibacillus parakoreensis]
MTDPPAVPAADATAAGERRTLDAFLDGYRDAVVRKTTGLSDADGRRHLVASATTVSGLIKHLRWVEYGWFDQLLTQRAEDHRRSHDRNWEFEVGADEALPTLVDEYQRQCEHSRRVVARYPLDHEVAHRRLGRVSLRWIYVHLIEETARHCGQIDILREQLDGATGF